MILGTDWSYWQGAKGVSDAFLDACHERGVRFLLNRASRGRRSVDTSYGPNVRRAKAKGWLTGAYHFFEKGSARAQAETFVHVVRVAGGFVGRLAVLDVETDVQVREVEGFLDTFAALVPGHPIGIYTSESAWRRIGNPRGLGDYLWQARWTDARPLPDAPPPAGFGGWATTPLWQYGQMQVSGKSVDGDAWYGTLDELRAWT